MMSRPLTAAIDNKSRKRQLVSGQALERLRRCVATARSGLIGAMRALSIIIMLVASLAVASRDAAAQQATLTDLGQSSGSPALAYGVTGDGKVVTGYLFGSPANQAFRWVNGTITPLGFLSGYTLESRGTAINSDGSVITGWSRSSTVDQAFRWTGGTMTGIGALPITSPPCGPNPMQFSQAFAISADGTTVTGQSVDNSVCNGDGFRWTSGAGMQALVCPISPITACFQNNATGVSSDGSIVVGTATQSGDQSGAAWRWTGGTFQIFAGPFHGQSGQSASAAGVTPDGNLVTGSIIPAFNALPQAYIWNHGTNVLTQLGNVPGAGTLDSRGLAINSDGSVVVGFQNTGNGVAARWTAAHGMRNIKTLLAASGANVANWALSQATGVSSDGTVIVGFGTGPCNCAAGWIASLPIGATTMTDTHDFNHDGKSDLLWRDTSGNTAVWLMNGGSVTSSGGLGQVPPAGYSIIGQRDFNGDGNADILWRDTNVNVSMWFMNGTQVTSSMYVASVPTNWTVYGTGDLNNDGKGDLLWRDLTTGNLVAWYMNGSQVVSQALLASVPTSWTIARTDSHGDIFWRDTSGNLAMWQVNGTQVVASVGFGLVPLNFAVAGVGDFNGDGYIDILWRDTNSGAVSIWFLQGTQVSSTASLGVVPTTYTIAQTGDYNGDGMSDIIWMDGSGNVSIWFMGASTVLSTASLGNVGTTWQLQSLNAE
jgi:probable HAF family extracellular repeat protein